MTFNFKTQNKTRETKHQVENYRLSVHNLTLLRGSKLIPPPPTSEDLPNFEQDSCVRVDLSAD